MEHKVTEGNSYLITAKGVTTVTDVESGYVLKSVPSNSQGIIVAISDKIEVSGECNIRPFDVDLLTRNHPATYSRQPISDWKAYMLKRAEMTGEQKNIDTVNRAIIEYAADSSALLPNRLIEDWQNLCVGYETWLIGLGEESPLDGAFWKEFFIALETWLADPAATISLTPTNSPYIDQTEAKPIVDFSVTGFNGKAFTDSCINTNTGTVIYFPNAKGNSHTAFKSNTVCKALIVPKMDKLVYTFYMARQSSISVYSPQAIDYESMANTVYGCSKFVAFSPQVTNWRNALRCSAGGEINSAFNMCSAAYADGAFLNAKMSVENISKTLDSLPTHTDGYSHVITFTGCPGAAELTQDSPSVASAVAKGWTVEL